MRAGEGASILSAPQDFSMYTILLSILFGALVGASLRCTDVTSTVWAVVLGLLAAIAMMCNGWEGAPQEAAPGFPSTWHVLAEGFPDVRY